MGYVDEVLLSDEQVIYKAKQHWFIYVKPLIFIFIGLIFSSLNYDLSPFMVWVGYILLAIGVYRIIMAYFNAKAMECALTNKRLILKTGFVKRDSLEIVLTNSGGIRITQGIIGRLFNFGTLYVTNCGVSHTYHMINEPLVFKKIISQGIDKL